MYLTLSLDVEGIRKSLAGKNKSFRIQILGNAGNALIVMGIGILILFFKKEIHTVLAIPLKREHQKVWQLWSLIIND
jgi:hypothetical protein